MPPADVPLTRRYLFGPVTADFADQHLRRARRAGHCLAFNPDGNTDLVIGPGSSWEAIVSRLPPGWQPDFLVLTLAHDTVPAGLWAAPLPRVALAADWHLRWHYYRRRLRDCELVLTDAAGVATLRRQGIGQARTANLYGPGRRLVEGPWPEGPRDIDILFVGSLDEAVQRERLPWLARLARLGERWRVAITTGLSDDAYRALLGRARVVFNRASRGEANRRAFEAAAAGALLFQEADNLELPHFFRDRCECVYYTPDNLEALLEHYLAHEGERRAIAGAAQARAGQLSYEQLWEGHLRLIEAEWPGMVARAGQRAERDRTDELLTRTWQKLNSNVRGDPALGADLEAAVARQPHAAALHNALGLVTALHALGPGPTPPAVAAAVAACFRQALAADPEHLLAGLNLAEALIIAGQYPAAIEQARQTLDRVNRATGLSPAVLDAGHFPPVFDHFRVEWERAAWASAGQPIAEARAKRELLRWRLHMLLGELTGDLRHYYEAVIARPDLPLTRGALGCALGRRQQPADALPHLRRALDGNPFDRDLARALFTALGESGGAEEQRRLARDRRLLSQAAPQLVPAESWFAAAPAEHLKVDPRAPLRTSFERSQAKWGPAQTAGADRPLTGMSPPGLGVPPVAPLAAPAATSAFVVSAGSQAPPGTVFPPSQGRVALCLIVKNEEANLPACLASAADLVDEIVVVDTGSTDATREVAARYGARVYDFPWCDSFAAARNECLRHARAAWIFWMDADDRLDADNRRKLRVLFASLSDENAAYAMKCVCLPDPQAGTSTVVDHIRLFRRHPAIRWQYRVHEQILPAVRQAGGEVRATDIAIHHVGYQDAATRKRKQERDLRLLHLDLADRPHDPFTQFNLGWSYEERGQPTEALGFLRRSLERSHPGDSIVRKLYALIAECHRQLGQNAEALAAIAEGRRYYPDDAQLLYQEAQRRREQGDRSGAIACLQRLRSGQEAPHFASVAEGLRGHLARHQLAILYVEEGRVAEAEAEWRAVLAERPEFGPAWSGLADLYIGQARWAELEGLSVRLTSGGVGGAVLGALLRVRGCLARKEPSAARRVLEQALGEHPDEARLWLGLGQVLMHEGQDASAAERALRRALELDPQLEEARQGLALLPRRAVE